jgi:hypothetical protein
LSVRGHSVVFSAGIAGRIEDAAEEFPRADSAARDVFPEGKTKVVTKNTTKKADITVAIVFETTSPLLSVGLSPHSCILTPK